MKNLNSITIRKLLSLMFIFGALVLVSCGDDDDDDSSDLTALTAKISEAEQLIASTSEGTAEGNYARGSQAELQSAIDLAQTVAASADSDQTALNNATTALTNAISVYESKLVEAIDPDNLVGHWTFDEGTGTTVADFSGNNFSGDFRTGHAAFGEGEPSWGTDRYGNAGKAMDFDKGAFVEVPYSPLLNPAQISISVWVNAAEILENNRFLGLHSWNGYKFQLQSANKSFFTIATTDGIYDNDTDPALETGEWIHLAVTFGGGEMVFYIDGSESNRVERTGDAIPVVDHNLAIGVGSSKYADTADNFDNDKIIPAAWGGYFHGSLDELRIYKSVLSGTQIQSIYDLEKP